MKLLVPILAAIITLLPRSADSATYTWTTGSGLFPDQVDPTMSLEGSDSPPVLTPSSLSLSTDVNYELTRYLQTGPNLAMPGNLEINANLRYVSGLVDPANQGSSYPRTHASISFNTLAGQIGNVLFIGQDRLFLLAAPDNLGPTVTIDTDSAFHDYKITVTGTALNSIVRVFQDGSLVLTGSIIQGVAFASTTMIAWGDSTYAARGISEWKSFSHNAAVDASPVNVTMLNGTRIEWPSSSQRYYLIQSSADLMTWTSEGLWRRGTGALMSYTDQEVTSRKFFRAFSR